MSIVYIVTAIFFMLIFPINVNIFGNMCANNGNYFYVRLFGVKIFNAKFKLLYKQLILQTKNDKKTIIKLKGLNDIKDKLQSIKDVIINKVLINVNYNDVYSDFMLPISVFLYTISYPVGGFLTKNHPNLKYGVNFITTANDELNLCFKLSFYLNFITILKYIFNLLKEKNK